MTGSLWSPEGWTPAPAGVRVRVEFVGGGPFDGYTPDLLADVDGKPIPVIRVRPRQFWAPPAGPRFCHRYDRTPNTAPDRPPWRYTYAGEEQE